MLRSKRLWMFTAVMICVACAMLFHWSQSRLVVSGEQDHLRIRFKEQPVQNLVVMSDSSVPVQVAQADRPKLSEYWIGVDGSPVDDVLRAQLELPAGQGIIIHQVLANSPAERAGLKQYDVLVAADDKSIAEIGDLAALVQERKETAVTLKVIRSAAPLTIEVTPQRRPAGQTGETCPAISPLDDRQFAPRVYQDVLGTAPTDEELNAFLQNSRGDKRARLANDLLRRTTLATRSCIACHAGVTRRADDLYHHWMRTYDLSSGNLAPTLQITGAPPDGGVELYIAGTPLALTTSPPTLPDDMTVTITRRGKEPARVQVTRGDQSWGTVEGKVSELPEEIRGYVSPFFATSQPVAVAVEALVSELRTPVYSPGKPAAADAAAAPPVAPPAAQPEPTLTELENQLKTLTRQLEQVQKTLDELRQ